MEMIYLKSLMVVVLCLQRGTLSVELCKDTESVSGAEGGDATLLIRKQKVKEVSWVFGGIHIGTASPNGFINIKSSILFESRLYGLQNGSLNITKLGKGDKGLYTATVFMQDEEEFVQCFNLSIYKKLLDTDIQIDHVTERNGTCSVNLTCTVDVPDTDITWTNSNGSRIGVTNQTLQVEYTDANVSYSCIAKNPVSKASRTVFPWVFCKKDNRGNPEAYIIPLSVGLIILCVAFLVFCWQNITVRDFPSLTKSCMIRKSQVQQPLEDNYCEVELHKVMDKKTRTEELYCTVGAPKNSLDNQEDFFSSSFTLYDTIREP